MTTVTSTPAVAPKSLHNVLDTTQTNKKLNPLNKASLLREDVCNDAVNEMSIGGQSTEPLARDSAPLYADEHLSDLSDETNATPPPAPSPAPPAPSTAPILIEVDVDTKTALYAPPGYARPPAGLTATCAVETKLKQKAAKPMRGGAEPPPPRHLVIHLPQFVTPKNLDPHPIRALPAPGEDNPCPALKAFFRRRAVTAAEPDDSASADSVGGAVDASEPADPTEAGQRSLPAIEKVLAPSVSISGKSPMHAVLVPRPRVPCATRGPGAARRTPGRAPPTGRSLLRVECQAPVVVESARPMGGLVNSTDYIEGHDPTGLRVLCKDAASPYWLLADYYIVVTTTPCDFGQDSAEYYTFDRFERAARLVFPDPSPPAECACGGGGGGAAPDSAPPERPCECLPPVQAPDGLTVGNKRYKKMAENPLRYALVYYVVPQAQECKRMLLANKPLYVFCTATGELVPLQQRSTAASRKLVGLHCAALPPLEELVCLFNMPSAPQRVAAAPAPAPAPAAAPAPQHCRAVQASVNKRAELALLVNCVNSTAAQVVDLDSEPDA